MEYLPRTFTRAKYYFPRRKYLPPDHTYQTVTDLLVFTELIVHTTHDTAQRHDLFLRQTIDVRLSTQSLTAGWASQCVGMSLDLQQTITYTKGFVSSYSFLDQLFVKQFCISFEVERNTVDIIQCQVESVLEFDQTINYFFTVPGASVFNESIISYLTLRDLNTVTKGNLTYKTISQSLTLNQIITYLSGDTFNQFLIQPIVINDLTTITKKNLYHLSITSSLSSLLSQIITVRTVNQIQELVTDNLTLVQDIGNSLRLIDFESVSQSFTLTDSIVEHTRFLRPVSDTLTLTSTITRSKVVSKSVTDIFIPIQTITINGTFNRTITSRLIFQEPTYQLIFSFNNIINIPVVIVNKKYRNVKYTSGAFAITLPPPEWDDTESLDNALAIKRTMIGGLYTYVKKVPSRKLSYQFSLGRLKIFEFEKFLIDTNAEPIIMYNWKDEIWAGFIIANPIEVTEAREYDNKITVEFEGIRIG